MDFSVLSGPGAVSSRQVSMASPGRQTNNPAATAASFADTVQISAAGQARQTASAQTTVIATMDSDQGEQTIDLDNYFSPAARHAPGQLPPLLMPSQRNIDAVSQYVNQTFPAFLSAHGISAAPATIRYDGEGNPQFPADYPEADKLRQALQDSPSMSRALSTVQALSEFNHLLSASDTFQQAYSAADSQPARNAAVARHASLLSSQTNASSILLTFSATGNLHIVQQPT